MKHTYLKILILALAILAAGISCKKIDLEKLPAVNTVEVTFWNNNSATLKGDVVDLGDGIAELGFQISLQESFQIWDTAKKNDFKIGEFTVTKTGLQPGTQYFARAYIAGSNGENFYGSAVTFITQSGGGSSQYLFYDDGVNVDGIGIDGGGNFDAAIRFYNADLPSGTLTVTKMRLFLRGDNSTQYYLTIRTIENGTTYLQVDDYINNPQNGSYTEYTLSNAYTIPSTGIEGMYFGYFVDDPTGSYPAGVDDGPNDPSGSGDLILLLGATNWENLSDYQLSGNWNIEVYVTTSKGEEFILTKKDGKSHVEKVEKEYNPQKAIIPTGLSSYKYSNN